MGARKFPGLATEVLNQNQRDQKIFSFPENIRGETEFKDWVEIRIFKSTPRGIANSKVPDALRFRQSVQTKETIVLPIPTTVQFSDSANWAQTEIGFAGGVSPGEAIFDPNKSTKDSVIGLFSKGLSEVATAGFETALKGASLFGAGTDFLSLLERERQSIRNTHLEVLFQSVGFRSFTFEYKLSPKSEREAVILYDILQLLRYHAAPDTKGNAEGSSYFIYPSQFAIDFKHNGQDHPVIPSFEKVVVTNVDTNYTSAGFWTAYKNGFPVELQLNIGFSDTAVNTKTRIKNEQGFKDSPGLRDV